MAPVIYTTYGIAMGYRPEMLAKSGGVRPAGARQALERTDRVANSRWRSWLGTMLIRVRMRRPSLEVRPGETRETKWLPGRLLTLSE